MEDGTYIEHELVTIKVMVNVTKDVDVCLVDKKQVFTWDFQLLKIQRKFKFIINIDRLYLNVV